MKKELGYIAICLLGILAVYLGKNTGEKNNKYEVYELKAEISNLEYQLNTCKFLYVGEK